MATTAGAPAEGGPLGAPAVGPASAGAASSTSRGGGGGACWAAGGGAPWGPPRAEFQRRKEQILASLDRSPKGSLDAPIVDFLGWLNAQASVVTTSSCSGRIAVFLGGSDPSASKGGEWLLISHEELADAGGAWARVEEALRGRAAAGAGALQGTLASLLLEPFVLHAECADVETAQQILEVAREAGFRESGISLGRRRVMVQLRTLALRLEVPLALDGALLAGREHFEALLRLANGRLAENGRRVQRLWARMREALGAADAGEVAGGGGAPWVLVCPQPMARAVKLAVEERGWMDESRKMAPLAAGEGAPPRIGIPVTNAAASALSEVPEDPDVVAAAVEPTGGSPADSTCEVHDSAGVEEADAGGGRAASGAPGGKAKRPATVAADLFALWRRSRRAEGPLALQRSDSLPAKERPPQRGAPAAAACDREREALRRAVLEVHRGAAGDAGAELPRELLAELQALGSLQWRGDVALLPRGALSGGPWERLAQEAQPLGGLWEPVRSALGARLLARQQEIRVDDGVRGGAVEVLAGSGDGWVEVPGPRGVRYTFDVTRCMFSEGNAAEKARVAEWEVHGETVLDLYAGIGFWTLPLLAAGARRVFACEWNPDAAEALRRGLRLLGEEPAARCSLLEGDNRRQAVRDATAGLCDRVLLGLIPTCRDGFPVAAAALSGSGGVMHVHWNVPSDEEAASARAVVEELQGVLRRERGQDWHCSITGIQRIKWFAPRVRHVRIDVRCRPEAGAA